MKVSVVNGLPVARAQKFIVPQIAFTPTVRLYLYTSAFQFFGLIYLCMYWDMAAVLHCHIDETTARAKFHDPTDVDLTSSADFIRCERKTVDGFLSKWQNTESQCACTAIDFLFQVERIYHLILNLDLYQVYSGGGHKSHYNVAECK